MANVLPVRMGLDSDSTAVLTGGVVQRSGISNANKQPVSKVFDSR